MTKKINPLLIIGGVAGAGAIGYVIYKKYASQENEKTGGSDFITGLSDSFSLDQIGDFFKSVMSGIGSIAGGTGDGLKSFGDTLADYINSGKDKLTETADNIKDGISGVGTTIKETLSDVGDGFSSMGEGAKNVFKGLGEGLSGITDYVKEAPGKVSLWTLDALASPLWYPYKIATGNENIKGTGDMFKDLKLSKTFINAKNYFKDLLTIPIGSQGSFKIGSVSIPIGTVGLDIPGAITNANKKLKIRKATGGSISKAISNFKAVQPGVKVSLPMSSIKTPTASASKSPIVWPKTYTFGRSWYKKK